MNITKSVVCLIAVSLTAALAAGDSRAPVGYDALSGADHLWNWNGVVRTAMSSSTDMTGGNIDFGNFHGEYRGEKILAKIDGPGSIYRVWAAWPSGTIKFYLDGAVKPEISCNFKSYLEGKCAGLPGDFAVGRWANYMPVPFEKSIIVTAVGFHMPGYYQVSYQTYDRSVEVKSFKKSDAKSSPSYANALEMWSGRVAEKNVGSQTSTFKGAVKAGSEIKAFEIAEPGVIGALDISNPDNPSDSLAGLTLKIAWDGEDVPAVEVPLDAFFMNRFGQAAKWPGGSFKSMFISADAKGYHSRFPMPFSKATISLVNNGADRAIEVVVRYDPKPLPDGAMRFHSEYREKDYTTNVTEGNTFPMSKPLDPANNYVVIDRKGRGHYVGCAIFVKAVSNLWWGEGDEMTYIDGAKEPQIRGTGTEDEFNWSWGFNPHMSPVSGTLPVYESCKESMAAQVIPAFRNKECLKVSGDNISYRLRPSDYVPFASSIKVTYEILAHSWITPNNIIDGNLTQDRGDDWSSIAYWYEAP